MTLEDNNIAPADLKRTAGKAAARWALCIWTIAAVAACLGRQHFWRTLLEAAFYLGFFALALRHELVLRTLAALRRSQRAFLALLIALMLFGQLHGRSADTYPFATWEMYTRRLDQDQHYYDFSGVLADGKEVPLRPAGQFLILNRQLQIKLSATGDMIAGVTNEQRRGRIIDDYERTLRALGRKYNDDQPDAHIVAVRVWRRAFSLEDYQRTGATTEKLFWETPLLPGK